MFKVYFGRFWQLLGSLLTLCIIVLSGPAQAEPYLAVKTGHSCAACHVNPSGGGARSSFGAHYGSQILPRNPGPQAQFDGGQITQGFRLGGNLRLNASETRFDDADTGRGFNTHTGQIYVALEPANSRFLLYFDQQLVPGSARNREAFVLTRLGDNRYLKVGNIMLPYGFRLEDDSAFVRQASQFNFTTSDNGVEWGSQHGKLHINAALTNGTGSQQNNDARFQYLGRAEYIANNWRLGSGLVFNDNEGGERVLANLFGGFNFLGNTLLFEVNHIEDHSQQNAAGDNHVQLVGLLEINRQIARGYNLKLTTEYWDPDTDLDDNERTRHSLLLEYTPYASVQLRGGVRIGDDSPERVSGNFTQTFLQLHMYY